MSESSIDTAFALAHAERAMRAIQRENARKETQQNASIIEGLQGIVAEMQEQNRILQKQAEEAKLASIEAKKEAKIAKIISIISVVTSIVFSLASLIVAIIK